MSPCVAHPICAKNSAHVAAVCMLGHESCIAMQYAVVRVEWPSVVQQWGLIQSSLLSCSARCIAKPAQVPSLACLPDGKNLQGSQHTLLQQGTSAPLPCLPWQQHCTGPAAARLAVSAEVGDITYEDIGYKYQVVHHKLFQLSSCLLGPS